MRLRAALLLLLACAPVAAQDATAAVDDPLRALFDRPTLDLARLDPSGTRLALLMGADGDAQAQEVVVLDPGTGERRVIFDTREEGGDATAVLGVDWLDDDSLVLRVRVETEGIGRLADSRGRLRVYVVELAGGPGGEADGEDVRRFLQTSAVFVDAAPDDENHALFAVPGSTSVLYRVDTSRFHRAGARLGKADLVDGGAFARTARVEEVEGLVLRWIPGSDGGVRAVFVVTEEGRLELRSRDEAGWSTVRSWATRERREGFFRRRVEEELFDGSEVPVPLAIADDGRFYAIADLDGRSALVLHDFETDDAQVLFQHPRAEIVDVHLGYSGGEPVSVSWLEEGLLRQHYFEGHHEDVARAIAERWPGESVQLLDFDRAGERAAALLRSPRSPGRLLLHDGPSGEGELVVDLLPGVDPDALAPVEAGSVDSDGLAIEYYLTRPAGDGPAPLVVMPHGGPFGIRDARIFDAQVQFLALHGMAVLQVNFRGSGGFGDDFLDAGLGAFGTGILDDIEAALDAVLADASIDAERICVAGSSYGGYAALMLAVRRPGAFACVAAHAGVTDIALIHASYGEERRALLRSWFVEDSEEAVDRSALYARMRERSPVYLAEQIRVPVLLTHGTEDLVVHVEHAHRLRAALPLEQVVWALYDGAGHGFDDPGAAFEHVSRLAEFLERHLGVDGGGAGRTSASGG